ncbi:hypothetical protein E5288_WYG000173 [Bos mutus]|uniref:Uncharacterized protein n=1 Tax=Bos mutus TaxID=72004 RepID=A0A6B0QRH6_9CETA|nr:hypothetical protein [Bos mutus]
MFVLKLALSNPSVSTRLCFDVCELPEEVLDSKQRSSVGLLLHLVRNMTTPHIWLGGLYDPVRWKEESGTANECTSCVWKISQAQSLGFRFSAEILILDFVRDAHGFNQNLNRKSFACALQCEPEVSREKNNKTCLELERYLQTEPRRISETFGEDLDCFLRASPPPCIEESFRRLDPLLLPVEATICEKSSAVDILLSRDKLLSETCLSLQPTSSSLDSYTAVNQAQLNAVTSLTPPSSPELSRHLVKTSQTLSAVDGTVTLKLVAKKAALGSVKVGGVATAAAAVAAAGTVKSGHSDKDGLSPRSPYDMRKVSPPLPNA